ncbi:histidine phosphatase family protein [Kitasatospora sp. NBC_01287]|uniref:histidine phosphatase family protein n=1 Tax=Kitasatospora sp. NBC_01287 TaxID=2903573 RepID=UPI00338E049A
MGVIVVVHHGQTVWSLTGRDAGTSEIALDSTGANQAVAIGKALATWRFLTLFKPHPASRHSPLARPTAASRRRTPPTAAQRVRHPQPRQGRPVLQPWNTHHPT